MRIMPIPMPKVMPPEPKIQPMRWGQLIPTLPPGAAIQTIGNGTYYLYNGVWFSPAYGANGVYYRVVPAP